MTAGRTYKHGGSDQCSATCEEGVWLGLCVLLACLACLLERGQPKCCRSAGLWQPNHLPNTHARYLRLNTCFDTCTIKIQVYCLHAAWRTAVMARLYLQLPCSACKSLDRWRWYTDCSGILRTVKARECLQKGLCLLTLCTTGCDC